MHTNFTKNLDVAQKILHKYQKLHKNLDVSQKNTSQIPKTSQDLVALHAYKLHNT